MRNFNHLTPAAKPTNKKWIGGIAALTAVSIAGGFGVNAWLNPAASNTGVSGNVSAPQTVTGDTINYRYGAVQLEVTENAGKIETIKELTATASRGWESVFPILNKEALAAQSSNFSNVSGATYSTSAYQEALASALGKLK